MQRRRIRRSALLLALLLCTGTSLEGRKPGITDPRITATAVPLDPADPARTRIGALQYLGGWELKGRDARFGGISSLSLASDDFLGITDNAATVRFTLRAGRITASAVGDLPAGPGGFLLKHDRDSEAHVVDPAGRHVWVTFERRNEIWRYDAALTRAEAHAAPARMRDWPNNGGAEAMVRLPDGRFVILSESADGPAAGSSDALLFAGDPALPGTPAIRFGYVPPEGYVPTSVERLPDGRLIILNRHASITDWFSAALTVIDPAAIREGAVLRGIEIARLAPPLTVDNMEGMVVVVERGRTVLWLISDDNFLPVERTLLLKFALMPDTKKPAPR